MIDSGEGIAAQDIPYVWDRYYKGDKARKRLVSGTGLGLSIARQVMDIVDGKDLGIAWSNLWCRVKARDGGRFLVRL